MVVANSEQSHELTSRVAERRDLTWQLADATSDASVELSMLTARECNTA